MLISSLALVGCWFCSRKICHTFLVRGTRPCFLYTLTWECGEETQENVVNIYLQGGLNMEDEDIFYLIFGLA